MGIYPYNGVTLEDLYKQADHALYEAKKHKNAYVFAEENWCNNGACTCNKNICTQIANFLLQFLTMWYKIKL